MSLETRPPLVVLTGRGDGAILAPVHRLWSAHLRVHVTESGAADAAIEGRAHGEAHLLGLGSGVKEALAVQQRRPGAVRSLVLAETVEPPPAAPSNPHVVALVVNGAQAPPEVLAHGQSLADLVGGERVVLPGVGLEVHRAGRRFLDLVLGAIVQAEPIALAEPDPAWRDRFAVLHDQILAAVGDRAMAVEHVGSTAVPGLVAKPVIDVALGVRDISEAGQMVPALREIGWAYAENLGEEPDHLFLFRLEGGRRAAHLHLTPHGSTRWQGWLTFRERLRASTPDAAAYTRLKRDLALQHPGDREAYTAGKAAFVSRVLATAREPGR